MTVSTQAASTARVAGLPRQIAGIRLVALVAGLFLLVVAPVPMQGGLLADEYPICLRTVHDGGYGPKLQTIWQDTGVVRPARLIELFLISETCTTVPYGLVILVPLLLKFAATFLLYGLLRDLRVPSPWPEIGAALWMLEPVGTEAALWPAALHVPLGLVLALAALRLYRRGLLVWAALTSVGAALSVEQVIFALPLAVWLTTPLEHRRRATVIATGLMATVVLAYATWPGENERHVLTLAQRWERIAAKRGWYLTFPAAGLGLYSGALGFLWAFPYSAAIVVAGALTGRLLLPRVLAGHTAAPVQPRAAVHGIFAAGILLFLVNVPLLVSEADHSARMFTPTWLVLSGLAAGAVAHLRFRRVRLVGMVAGTCAAFALLSLALSAYVRVQTDAFNRRAAQWIAARTRNGDVVAVCDVDRTVVKPAPLGAFHLHELQWISPAWIEYHTGRLVEIRRSGEGYGGSPCPDLRGADLVIRFPRLVDELQPRPQVTFGTPSRDRS
jgi:hypothetical protein